MSSTWTSDAAETFWSMRPCALLSQLPNMHNRQQEYADSLESDTRQESLDKQQFMATHQLSTPDKELLNLTKCVHNLKFWVTNSSWSYCQQCFLLKGQKLGCRFAKRPRTKPIKECLCSKDRYHVPLATAIPDVLKNMTAADLRTCDHLIYTINRMKESSMVTASRREY